MITCVNNMVAVASATSLKRAMRRGFATASRIYGRSLSGLKYTHDRLSVSR